MAERWVSITEAARLEAEAGRAVNKSSISRFLVANPDVPVKRGPPSEAHPSGIVQLVDYEALVWARTQSLDVQDKLADRQTAPANDQATAAPSSSPSRKQQLVEEKLELDLAERKGEVVAADAVRHAIAAAGATFVQSLERRRRTLATRITGLEEVRAVELELKRADNEVLEALSKALASALTGADVSAA